MSDAKLTPRAVAVVRAIFELGGLMRGVHVRERLPITERRLNAALKELARRGFLYEVGDWFCLTNTGNEYAGCQWEAWIGANPRELVGVPCPRDGREYDCQCARCGSSLAWEECSSCGGDGFSGHDCGDDACCCLEAEENMSCGACGGQGGGYDCLSSPGWCQLHPMKGREGVSGGTVEWFPIGASRASIGRAGA